MASSFWGTQPYSTYFVQGNMFVLFEFLGYLIIEILFAIPGAILRWTHLKITGKKTSAREYSTRKAGWYYIAGLLLVMAVSLFAQISN